MDNSTAEPYQTIQKFSKFIQQVWSELFSVQKVSFPIWQDLKVTHMTFNEHKYARYQYTVELIIMNVLMY